MKPLCMDDAEFALWEQANATIRPMRNQAARPCSDCPMAYHLEMLEAGRCDGVPLMKVRKPVTEKTLHLRRLWREAAARKRAKAAAA